MLEIENRTDFYISSNLIDFLEEIVNIYSFKDVELIVTNDKEMKILNREYRGVDKTTDVISFPFKDTPFSPLGSIIINFDAVKRGAKEYQHDIVDEFILLFIHGVLHLIGYDHEKDEKMRKEEEKLIKRFHLPTSLIIRSEERC